MGLEKFMKLNVYKKRFKTNFNHFFPFLFFLNRKEKLILKPYFSFNFSEKTLFIATMR